MDVLKDEVSSEEEAWDEADYMRDEGWVETVGDNGPPLVRLLHKGVKAAEAYSFTVPTDNQSEKQDAVVTVAQKNNSDSETIYIFISHSSQDEKVAEALADLFKNALNLPTKKIRCTSVPAYKLEPGASVEETLRREIDGSHVFIGLITPASVKSTYVLFELGARWGSGPNRTLIPVLASGADYSYLHDPLKNRNPIRCEVQAEVRDLIDTVASVLNVTPDRQSAYQRLVEDLVKKSKPKRERKQIQEGISP